MVRSLVAVMEYGAARDFTFEAPAPPPQEEAPLGGDITDLMDPAFTQTAVVVVRAPCALGPIPYTLNTYP